MKIVFFIHSLSRAGAEKQLLLTARRLQEKGHSCAVFTLCPADRPGPIHPLYPAVRDSGVPFYFGAGGFWGTLALVGKLRACLRSHPAPILWCWGNRADLIGKLLTCLDRPIRLVLGLRSAYETKIRRLARLYRFRDSHVALYLSNSQRNVDMVAGILPGIGSRCRVIYNALEDEELDLPPVALPCTRPPILDVRLLGNLRIHLKGYDLLLQTAAKARAQSLPFRFTIGGRPFEDAPLRAEIESAGLRDYVHLAGEITRPAEFLRQGHLFLLTSRVEGMPNALIEAMSAGLPCVSTRVGDVADFLRDGIDGRLARIGDADDIFAALTACWHDWEKSLEFGRSARLRAQALFRIAPVVDAVEAELRSISGQPAPR